MVATVWLNFAGEAFARKLNNIAAFWKSRLQTAEICRAKVSDLN